MQVGRKSVFPKVVGIAMAVLMIGGCGSTEAQSESSSFSGPYAADFQKIYESTNNALIKDIVKDSRITDAEFEEFKTQYEQCVSSHGLTWSYDPEGIGEQIGGNADNPNPSEEDMQAAEAECQPKTGYLDIMPLYQAIKSNPDKLGDDALTQLTIDCLVRHGLLESGMTVPEYQSLLQDDDAYTARFGKYMDWESNPEDYQYFYDCTQDPVNAK